MYIFFKVKKVKCYVNDGLRNFKSLKDRYTKKINYTFCFTTRLKNEKMLVT